MQVTFDIPANQLDATFLASVKTLFQNKHIKITIHDTETTSAETPHLPVFGCMKDSVIIHGDIVESVGEIWDAEHE